MIRRLHSQSYDSVRQRHLAAVPSPPDLPLAHPLLARLRLDVVLSGQVVLTDAQVLDGPWFRDLDPHLLVELLQVPGSPPPFVVRSRAGSLLDAAVAMLSTDDGRVKPFAFSAVPEPHRRRVAAAMRRAHDQGRPAPTDLDQAVALLVELGLPPQEAAAMARGWQRWSDAATTGRVAVEPFVLDDGDGFRRAAAADLGAELDQLAVPEATIPPAHDLIDRFVEGATRTELYRVLDARAVGADDDGLRDGGFQDEVLRDLTDRLFGHLFKHQHRADDFDDRTRLQLRPTEQARRGRADEVLQRLAELGWTEVDLRSDFLVRLALVDAAALAEWHVEHADELTRWRTSGSDGARHLKRALRQLELGVLATVAMARLKQVAELPFEQLTRSQSIARYLAPGRDLAVDEAVALAAGKLPVLNQLARIEFAVDTVRKVATRKQTNWHLLSSDFAVRRRERP